MTASTTDDDSGRADRPVRSGAWSLPLAAVSVGLVAELTGDPARHLLRYGREPIAEGEGWRLLTGHLVHLGWPHYLMNAAALLLIWGLVGRRLQCRQWLFVLAVIVAGIDLGFWLRDTQLLWYVGLSGVLHGILAAGLIAAFSRARLESLLIGALLLAKLVYEQAIGAMPGTAATAGGTVVVNAHLYGAMAGAVAAAVLLVRAARRTPI